MSRLESIPFLTDDGSEIAFCIIEQTRINGKNYLLVSQEEEEDSEEELVYILRESAEDKNGMKTYEMVEDEEESAAVFKIFEQLIDDMDFLEE